MGCGNGLEKRDFHKNKWLFAELICFLRGFLNFLLPIFLTPAKMAI